MKIENIIDVQTFTTEINEDIDDLNEAMSKQTARAAWYGILHSQAKRQAAQVALLVKSVNAALVKKYRVALTKAATELAEEENSKPERITADMVNAEVALDADMRKWLMAQIDADEIETVCRVAYDAFKTRRDMLVSLGHLTREQMRTQLSIQGHQSAASVQSSYKDRRAARRGEGPETEQ